MDCNETRLCLAAHLDDELDVMQDAAVVAHLDGCPACAAAALAHTARRGLIRDKLPRFTASRELERQIRLTLRAEEKPARSPLWWLARSGALAAGLALAVLGGYQLGLRQMRAAGLVDELASARIRALMTGHTVEVASTDQHMVKPWFAGKLDFTPPVNDLATEGFPLIGGRRDRVGNRTVAVLVYQRRQHLIELYIWPADYGNATVETTRDGFNVLPWEQTGNRCVAVSDLALDELKEFRRLSQSGK